MQKQLKTAVDACTNLSPVGDCTVLRNHLHGPIGEWDVSQVIDVTQMFYYKESFNSDISKWDVSSVTNMQNMFSGATSFNIDISRWDVSSVTTTDSMFKGATSFAQILCGTAWLESKATKDYMFTGSSGGLRFGCENLTHSCTRKPPPLIAFTAQHHRIHHT